MVEHVVADRREVVVSQSLSSQSIVKRAPNHVATDMAGETVVLDMKSGMYYGMDGVAGSIWAFVDQPRTIADIQAAVVAEYDIDAESCERDVATFVESLRSAGLVEIVHENAA
jgi:hypothetical protein